MNAKGNFFGAFDLLKGGVVHPAGYEGLTIDSDEFQKAENRISKV